MASLSCRLTGSYSSHASWLKKTDIKEFKHRESLKRQAAVNGEKCRDRKITVFLLFMSASCFHKNLWNDSRMGFKHSLLARECTLLCLWMWCETKHKPSHPFNQYVFIGLCSYFIILTANREFFCKQISCATRKQCTCS